MKSAFTAGILIFAQFDCSALFAQVEPGSITPTQRVQVVSQRQRDPAASEFPRFGLDFKGGTPRQLVEAIEGTGVTLNVIIPEEASAAHIPAFRMRNVTLPQLFEAIELSSQAATFPRTASQAEGTNSNPYMMDPRMMERYFGVKIPAHGWAWPMPGTNHPPGDAFLATAPVTPGSGPMPGTINSAGDGHSSPGHYGFRTQGTPQKDSIWYFFWETVSAPHEPRSCQFFMLEPYLSKYTIEDITTAIETGWNMLGTKNSCQLSYHKDTKLLIAVGPPQNIDLIQKVLAQLREGINLKGSGSHEGPPASAPKL